jgi:hypothetical protein
VSDEESTKRLKERATESAGRGFGEASEEIIEEVSIEYEQVRPITDELMKQLSALDPRPPTMTILLALAAMQVALARKLIGPDGRPGSDDFESIGELLHKFVEAVVSIEKTMCSGAL